MTTILPIKQQSKPTISWEILPDNFILPDDPVENIYQPLLAAALTEALDLAGLISPQMLIASNMGITVKINTQTVIKAPDWFYVTKACPSAGGTIRRSYTPKTEGEIPALVMEFLSENDAGEYSSRPTYPYGKMYFYEQILQVPLYIIFEPESALLEIYQLQDETYQIQRLNPQGRYFIESMGLYLGVWYGTRLEQTTHWLRWWDQEGNLLLWGTERIAQEQQKVEQEKQRADKAEQELARLKQLLQDRGINEP